MIIENVPVRAVLIGAALAGGLLVSTATARTTETTTPSKPARACFSLSDWHGWSSPSRDVLYLKVRAKDVYRLDLSRGSSQLQWPGSHLVTVVRGSDQICSPIDLDLRVADGHGMEIPLFIKAITKLTPEEIAALPKKDRP